MMILKMVAAARMLLSHLLAPLSERSGQMKLRNLLALNS
jgi:hypothetical protein